MALNRSDVELAKWLINQISSAHTIHASPPPRPWDVKPISIDSLMSLNAFIDAVGEHLQHPTSDVRSREWRRLIYAKLLEDPTALHQFTEQALEKFGLEELSQMVSPDIRDTVFDQKLSNMTPHELSDRLKQHNQLELLLEFLADREPDFLEALFSDEKEAAQNEGYQEGHEDGKGEGYQEGEAEGRQEGYQQGYDEGHETGKSEGYSEGYNDRDMEVEH